eukprot:scaffold29574_cov48-Phaeocystis_antarctica.AAC.2
MVKVPPWQGPSSPSVPPRGAPGGSGRPGTPKPLGAQPRPRVLERAASKAADSTAFGHAGSGLRLRTADARWRLRGAGVAHAPCSRPGCTTHDGAARDGTARTRAAPLHDVSLLLLTTSESGEA